MNKLLKTQSKIFLLILAAAVINGCGKERPEKEYIARVNDSYFTKNDMAMIVDSGYGKNLYRNEIVRNWINEELLYQEAKSSGILKNEDFLRTKIESEKRLAITFFVDKLFKEEQLSIEPSEVKDYYDKHRDNFKLFHNAFLVNLVQFNDEDKAISFREDAFTNGWQNSAESFKSDSNIVSIENTKLVYEYEIQPADLVRIIRELLPGEISIVINDGMGNYFIVQLLEKYARGSTPPYEIIDDLVRSRFVASEKEQFIKNYVQDLYSKNDIEVK